MEALSRRMPYEFQVAAASQDSIGWVEFLHGKVAVGSEIDRDTVKVLLPYSHAHNRKGLGH
jgi:hypothetical protein